jgi:hypothetical protein
MRVVSCGCFVRCIGRIVCLECKRHLPSPWRVVGSADGLFCVRRVQDAKDTLLPTHTLIAENLPIDAGKNCRTQYGRFEQS